MVNTEIQKSITSEATNWLSTIALISIMAMFFVAPGLIYQSHRGLAIIFGFASALAPVITNTFYKEQKDSSPLAWIFAIIAVLYLLYNLYYYGYTPEKYADNSKNIFESFLGSSGIGFLGSVFVYCNKIL